MPANQYIVIVPGIHQRLSHDVQPLAILSDWHDVTHPMRGASGAVPPLPLRVPLSRAPQNFPEQRHIIDMACAALDMAALAHPERLAPDVAADAAAAAADPFQRMDEASEGDGPDALPVTLE